MATDEGAKGAQENVWSIAEWCHGARVSPGFFYKEKRLGRGPRTADLGRRTLVIESPREYCERLAQEAAAARPQVAEAL